MPRRKRSPSCCTFAPKSTGDSPSRCLSSFHSRLSNDPIVPGESGPADGISSSPELEPRRGPEMKRENTGNRENQFKNAIEMRKISFHRKREWREPSPTEFYSEQTENSLNLPHSRNFPMVSSGDIPCPRKRSAAPVGHFTKHLKFILRRSREKGSARGRFPRLKLRLII